MLPKYKIFIVLGVLRAVVMRLLSDLGKLTRETVKEKCNIQAIGSPDFG